MDWLLKHKLSGIVIVIVLAGIAWYMLSGSSPSPDSVLTSESAAQIPPEAQELVETLLTLRAVTLQGTIFSNPSFQVLKDFSTPIIPEPIGRPNPFAPLGVDIAGSVGTSSTSVKPASAR